MYSLIMSKVAAEHVRDLQAEAAVARRARAARRARRGAAAGIAADAPALDRAAHRRLPCPEVIVNC